MSLEATIAAWELDLDGPAKLVALALADHHRPGGSIFPSMNRIASRTGMSQRTVQRKLETLERKGLIAIDKPAGRWKTKAYTLLFLANRIWVTRSPMDRASTIDRESPQSGHGVANSMDRVSTKSSYLNPLNNKRSTASKGTPKSCSVCGYSAGRIFSDLSGELRCLAHRSKKEANSGVH